MIKTIRTILRATLAIAVAAAPVAFAATDSTNKTKAAASLDALFGDPTVAKAANVEIKRSQLDAVMVNLRLMAAQQAERAGQQLTQERLMLMEREALDELIFLQLTLNRATAADKEKARTRFDKEVAKYKADSMLTDEQFTEQQNRMLRVQGITREQWEKQSVDSQVKLAVIERETGILVTDADKKKFYDENPSEFEVAESVRVAHVLFSTKDPADPVENPVLKRDIPEDKKKEKRAKAADILKRARAGEDFTALAKEFSEDPGVKNNNGEYRFTRTDPFVEEFKTASFALSSNQVSDVVTTVFGYHIIKQLELVPSRKVPFDEIAERISDYLRTKALREKAPGLFQKLAADAKVEILDQRLNSIERPAQPPAVRR
jgi:parvulin-like peptidyl-prolyl isomerase